MNLENFIARQLRRPSGLVGRFLVGKSLNKSNGGLEDMGLELMNVEPGHSVLEIGFGNGRLISKMAELMNEGSVMGIDISGVMIRQASRKNKEHIRSGKVKLLLASVENIPANDDSFDRIFTANTIYFWPDPEANILEIKRVLKPGGKFYCALRLRDDMMRMPIVRNNREIFINLFSRQEIIHLLENSGFKNVKWYEEKRPQFSDVIVAGEK